MADDDRLERIERKLDSVSEALATLARLDERIVTLFARQDTIDHRLERISERLALVERANYQRAPYFTWANQVAIALLGAAALAAVQRFWR